MLTRFNDDGYGLVLGVLLCYCVSWFYIPAVDAAFNGGVPRTKTKFGDGLIGIGIGNESSAAFYLSVGGRIDRNDLDGIGKVWREM